MQTDLRDKVASGTLGFNKRAKNILKAVLIGTGLNVAVAAGAFVSLGEEKRGILTADSKNWEKENPQVPRSERVKEFLKSDTEGAKIAASLKPVGTINNVVTVGAIISSTVMLNKASKRKQEGNLSAVETELAKREMKTREINEPQRG